MQSGGTPGHLWGTAVRGLFTLGPSKPHGADGRALWSCKDTCQPETLCGCIPQGRVPQCAMRVPPAWWIKEICKQQTSASSHRLRHIGSGNEEPARSVLRLKNLLVLRVLLHFLGFKATNLEHRSGLCPVLEGLALARRLLGTTRSTFWRRQESGRLAHRSSGHQPPLPESGPLPVLPSRVSQWGQESRRLQAGPVPAGCSP